MASPGQPSASADALTSPLNFIAELIRASPPLTSAPVLSILVALQVNRVRLLLAGRDGYTKVLERRVGRGVLDAESHAQIERLASLNEAVRDAMVELTKLGAMGSIDIALDLTVSTDKDASSADFDTSATLEGEALATLTGEGSTAAPSVAESEVPPESYLTAAQTAVILGVAKSTIIRRINKGEMIGFRGFKKSLRIPREQFKDEDVVAGIAEILALFRHHDAGATFDHREAWTFLCSTLYPGDSAPRPIDRLRTASAECPPHLIVAELALVKESLDHGDHI